MIAQYTGREKDQIAPVVYEQQWYSVYNPRMILLVILIVLVLEFESRRGEILTLFVK